MSLPHPSAPASLARGIPDALRGTLCRCEHVARHPGQAHPAAYLLQVGAVRNVGCTSAAAAFAARHGLAFPLTAKAP